MILSDFQYLAPRTIEDACRLLDQYGEHAKIMAGGTDLINFMKVKAILPDYVIDIKEIPGLDDITFDAKDGLTIGALTKLRDIELSTVVKEHCPVLSDAVHLIASTQIRSKGTLAGNICNASPSADSVPSLFALDAKLVIQGKTKKRVVPIRSFYKGFKKLDLAKDELVTAIQIPPLTPEQHTAYMAHTVRKAMDLAIVGVGVNLTINQEGICTDAAIALGAVAITCVPAPHAEELLIGKKITPELAAEAGVAAMSDCKPISDVRASAEYRHDMVRVFTKRAILKALSEA